jgi:hypothetical protein
MYRSAHSEEYRVYMREYMRAYRERKRRTDGDGASPSAEPASPGPSVN